MGDMFPRTIKSTECANVSYGISSCHVETVALLSKIDADKHLNVEFELDELNLTSVEVKASYAQVME